MTIYNLVIAEEYNDKTTGEQKTYWHRVGRAFSHESGTGHTLRIPPGVALSGKVLMLEQGEKEPESAKDAFNEDAE